MSICMPHYIVIPHVHLRSAYANLYISELVQSLEHFEVTKVYREMKLCTVMSNHTFTLLPKKQTNPFFCLLIDWPKRRKHTNRVSIIIYK